MKKVIPSGITALNLLCGFSAILLNDPINSALLIFLGAFLDLFDGLVARLLKASSNFGKDLDSLADIVTFGVAPAFIYYNYFDFGGDIAFIVICGMIPVFSAIRLAKFNNDTNQSITFKGLPTPANGIFITSIPFVLADYNLANSFDPIMIYMIPLTFAILLVLPFDSFSFKELPYRTNTTWVIYLFLAIALALVVFFQLAAIPLIVLLYIMLSIVKNVISTFL